MRLPDIPENRTEHLYFIPDYMVDSDEDDNDYLAASMASQKSVCSDAFDFLFDSQNLKGPYDFRECQVAALCDIFIRIT